MLGDIKVDIIEKHTSRFRRSHFVVSFLVDNVLEFQWLFLLAFCKSATKERK